jgi:hypothetical protein
MNPREVGCKYEDIVLAELLKYNPDVKLNGVLGGSYKEEYSYYDFEDFGGIDSKYDEISSTTNRIMIDVHCNKIPSGLSVTKAKYWIIFNKTMYYIIETNTLKWLIQYKGFINYYNNEYGRLLKLMIEHSPFFYNSISGNIMEVYYIPIPAILMFCTDNGLIENFNLKMII